MLKRSVCYLGAFFFSLSSYAATWDNLQTFQWPTCDIPQNDWRIGFGIGIEYLNVDAKLKSDLTKFGIIQFGDQDQTQQKVQVSPAFELGKTSFNHYYTGINISWHYSNAKKESRTPFKFETYFKHKFRMSYYINILAKLGYRVTPKTMVYILGGPSIAKWSHKTHQMRYQTLDDTFKIKKTSVGLGVGAGLEYFFCNGLALSVDYTHHFYKIVVAKNTMRFLDAKGTPPRPYPRSEIISKKVKPSSDAIVVRLSYFF
ncbi:MAG: hypothetical protein BGO77_02900 [Caedibacter sp. 37-49]|mgnify:CR=1 FL=1|nr:MAG: hypothetical protein BGO77_02900 [Caedibacter sp. 37-49]